MATRAIRVAISEGDGISVLVEVASPEAMSSNAHTSISFTVALIPHTREVTTLGQLAEGDDVNIEVDVVAKYVERLVAR